MTALIRPLTQDEAEAIAAYAESHGRNWKSALREDWEYARVPGLIQSIRNSHGPTWLTSFRLPGEDPTRRAELGHAHNPARGKIVQVRNPHPVILLTLKKLRSISIKGVE